MAKSANLKVNVTADATQAQNAMAKLSKEMEGLTKIPGTGAAAGVLVWVAAAEKAAQAVKAIYNQGKEYVDLYAVQQQAEVRLQATLKATGNTIGVTASEMYSLASSLQSVTTTGDETILGMQQIFIAGQKITREMLPQVIELSLDMAEAMGKDATSAAKDLGKALADPTKGLEELKSSNIFFTDSEKAKIAELQTSNRLMDAQQVILDKVAKAYGGIAREVASTDTGKIEQIKNVMGDIKEGLGHAIVRSLSPSFQWLLDRLEDVQTKINDMNASRDLMKDLKGGVSVGSKYSPEVILSENAKLQEQIAQDEKTLRVAYASARGIKPEDAGAFSSMPKDYWINRSGGQYLQTYERNQENKEQSKRLGQAYVIAKNKTPAEIPGVSPSVDAEATGSTGTAASALSLYEQILAATSATEAAQRRILDTRIADNKALKETLSTQVAAGKITQGEADTSKILLDQQIALDRGALAKMDAPTPPKVQTAGDFIGSNISLSNTAQVAAVDNNIALAESFLSASESGSAQEKQIQEIIEALKEQRKEILGTGDDAEEAAAKAEAFTWATVQASAELIGSVTGLISSAYQGQINELQATLNKQKAAWANYYADLKDQYQSDRDSLDAQYHWGRISSEEYFSSLTQLNKNKRKAEEDGAKSEEALAKKIDALKQKQFNAEKTNSIVQATIAGAVGIANIWKTWAANPIYAGILTGITAASVGVQIATVASSKYTPLASGGVVTGPTYALIGEGGQDELVLPLSEAKNRGFGGDGGGMTLNMYVENVYTGDDLSRAVYDGVSKLQKTGALPPWKKVI